MIVRLLTEHHLEFLIFKGGCTVTSESSLVKMPHCWKSHVLAQLVIMAQMTPQNGHQIQIAAKTNLIRPKNMAAMVGVGPKLL